MQKRTLETLDGAKVAGGPAMHSTVRRITDNRMPDRAQVDPDLMRAAGCDRDMQK